MLNKTDGDQHMDNHIVVSDTEKTIEVLILSAISIVGFFSNTLIVQ